MPFFDWVKAAVLALRLVNDFVQWVKREKVRTEAERAIIERAEDDIRSSIQAAQAARDGVTARFELAPGELRQPDQFTRPD